MSLTTVSPPAVEPVDLDEAKLSARVDSDDEDTLVTSLISVARQQFERLSGIRLITQDVRLTCSGFSPQVALPVWPVQSVVSVNYTATDGTDTLLASDQYRVLETTTPWSLAPAYGVSWPATRIDHDTVKIVLRVGFGDAGADVPTDILHAIKALIAQHYEQRQASDTRSHSDIPFGVRDIIETHRFWV